jgi:preprotein translocase subunit SecA
MFNEMIARVKEETLGILFRVQIAEPEKIQDLHKPKPQAMVLSHGDGAAPKKPVQRKGQKVGRNDPCPCGSGKKYKKCCGSNKEGKCRLNASSSKRRRASPSSSSTARRFSTP